MSRRVVIIGAGYAGLGAAVRLARKTRGQDVRLTLVNRDQGFVERVRLHQLAADQRLRAWPLATMLHGTGIELLIATVTSIDVTRRRVHLERAPGAVEYDTLIYALGSGLPAYNVPGVSGHAHFVVSAEKAARLRDRIGGLSGGRIAVVGGGLTGLEVATEIAEARPDLDLHLCADTEPGHWLAPAGQRHLRQALDRLGITTHLGRVSTVRATSVDLDHDGRVDADVTVWTAGFAVPTLARDSGISADERNRIVVDDRLRSVSHPEIYAVGDAAAATTAGGESRMSCQTAIPMGR